MVITYIQPTDEVLEPPIEKDHSDISHKYVIYNNKLFQLVDNKADGLCLFYGVTSFLNNQNISLGNDSFLVSVRNIQDKETFLESGIVASLLDAGLSFHTEQILVNSFNMLIFLVRRLTLTCSHLNTIRT